MPMIKVDLTTIPLAFGHADEVETLEFLMKLEDVARFVDVLEAGAERAKADAEYGLVLPEET